MMHPKKKTIRRPGWSLFEVRNKDCGALLEEILLFPPFREKGVFCGRPVSLLSCGGFGLREVIESLDGGERWGAYLGCH